VSGVRFQVSEKAGGKIEKFRDLGTEGFKDSNSEDPEC
jgi:hypothetical protein